MRNGLAGLYYNIEENCLNQMLSWWVCTRVFTIFIQNLSALKEISGVGLVMLSSQMFSM